MVLFILIGLVSGILANFIGSNIIDRKSIFKGIKCIDCHKKLPLFHLSCDCGRFNYIYIITPIINGLLGYLIYSKIENAIEISIAFILIFTLLSITVSDIIDKIVPDEIIIVSLISLIILRILSNVELWYMPLIGMMSGFLFFYAIALVGERIYKQEVLGGGDVKLYAIIGLVLGVSLMFLSVFFASLIGLIVTLIVRRIKNSEERYLPFVPFITIGVLVSYFYGIQILDWYMNLF